MSNPSDNAARSAIVGLVEFGIGATFGTTLDSLAPVYTETKPTLTTAIEAGFQIAATAIVVQVGGSWVIRNVAPDSPTGGLLLVWGLIYFQPNLIHKLDRLAVASQSFLRSLVVLKE